MNKIIAIKVSSNKESQECIEELKKYGVPVYFSSFVVPSYGYICICYDSNTFQYTSSFAAEADNLNEDIKSYEYSDIEFFKLPDEIKEKMVSRTKQKNCIGFIIYLDAGDSSGGFTWRFSEEGEQFWRPIIEDRQFDVFFTKYPRNHEVKVSDYTPYYTSLDWDKLSEYLHADFITNINDHSKILKDESRLQKQENPLRRGNSAESVRFHGRKHKARIASQHLSYQKAVGRG